MVDSKFRMETEGLTSLAFSGLKEMIAEGDVSVRMEGRDKGNVMVWVEVRAKRLTDELWVSTCELGNGTIWTSEISSEKIEEHLTNLLLDLQSTFSKNSKIGPS